jgi:hypothetical protein
MMYYKPGGLKQQKFILSQFWSLENQVVGVDKAMFSLKAVGKPSPSSLPSFWWLLQPLMFLGQ